MAPHGRSFGDRSGEQLNRALNRAPAAASASSDSFLEAWEATEDLGGFRSAAAAASEAVAAAARVLGGLSFATAGPSEGGVHQSARRWHKDLAATDISGMSTPPFEMITQPEKSNEKPAARFLAGVKASGRPDLPPRAPSSGSEARSISRVQNPKKRNLDTNEVDQPPDTKSKVGDAACAAGKASKKTAPHSKDAGKRVNSILRAPLVAPATRFDDMPSFKSRPIGITGRRFILKHEFVTKSGAVFSGYSFQVNTHGILFCYIQRTGTELLTSGVILKTRKYKPCTHRFPRPSTGWHRSSTRTSRTCYTSATPCFRNGGRSTPLCRQKTSTPG
jgi:hypothetical protein